MKSEASFFSLFLSTQLCLSLHYQACSPFVCPERQPFLHLGSERCKVYYGKTFEELLSYSEFREKRSCRRKWIMHMEQEHSKTCLQSFKSRRFGIHATKTTLTNKTNKTTMHGWHKEEMKIDTRWYAYIEERLVLVPKPSATVTLCHIKRTRSRWTDKTWLNNI